MKIELPIMKMLLFTALLCSSDVVAAVSIVSYEAQPKLFSCVFGEGVFNDIVSIILFNTVESLQHMEFMWYTPFVILIQFILLGIVSIAMGLIFGVILSIFFKYARFITISPIIETFMVFSFCMTAYFVTGLITINGLEMSGIIALLTCGILCAHYTYYNMSPQGRQTATLSFTFIGELAEAAVYSYVGLSLYSTIPTWWSWSFVFIQLAIIFGGRIFGVITTFYTFRLCCKKKTIKFNELLFITYAGMIRGAIAFALVLKIKYYKTPEDKVLCEDCYSPENYDLAVSTTLMLVMLTTLIFGTFMDPVQKFLVPPKPQERSNTLDHSELLYQRAHSDISHHEEIVHPNEEKSMISDNVSRRPSYLLPTSAKPNSWVDSAFVRWFTNIDEKVLRPFLIYKYDLEKIIAEDRYEELMTSQIKAAKNVEDRMEMMTSFRDGRLFSQVEGVEGVKGRSYTTHNV